MFHLKQRVRQFIAYVLIVTMLVPISANDIMVNAQTNTKSNIQTDIQSNAQTSIQSNAQNGVQNNVQSDDNSFGLSGTNMSVQGINSVGNLISCELLQEQSAQAQNGGYTIYDITMSGNVATVTYSSVEDCSIVVAVYDESNSQMIASGIAPLTATATQVSVTIETDNMPQYYILRAYFVDSYNMKPLAQEYNNPMYTKEMQELMKLTVDDFDPALVLNLDDDKTTNFMVYEETTILIASDANTNIVSTVDDDIYVIRNIDDSVRALKSGDIVSIGSGANTVIFKVDSISIDGTTATIDSGEIELNDVFEYVKVEASATPEDVIVDESSCGEGITYLGEYYPEVAEQVYEEPGQVYVEAVYPEETEMAYGEEVEQVYAGGTSGNASTQATTQGSTQATTQASTQTSSEASTEKETDFYIDGSVEIKDIFGELELTGNFEAGKVFKLGNGLEKEIFPGAKVEGEVKFVLNLNGELDVYCTDSYDYVKFTVGFSAAFNGELQCEGEKEFSAPITTFRIPLASAVTLTIKPQVVGKLGGKVVFTAGVTGTTGFVYDSSAETKLRSIALGTKEAKLELEGSFAFGFKLNPSLNVVSSKVASIETEGEALLVFTVTYEKEFDNDDNEDNNSIGNDYSRDDDNKHACDHCISGECNLEISINPKITFVNKVLNLGDTMGMGLSTKIQFGEWYYSILPEENRGFGFGECPYKDMPYAQFEICVKDENGRPLKEAVATIIGTNSAGKEYYKEFRTDDDGCISEEVPAGDYMLHVGKGGYGTQTRKMYNWRLSRKWADFTLVKMDAIDSLVLTKDVVIEDPSQYANKYITSLEIVEDGFTLPTGTVTENHEGYDFIFPVALFIGAEIDTLYIDDEVTTIPVAMFRNCRINSIVWGGGIQTIEDYAFHWATIQDMVELPESVVNIGMYAFGSENITINKLTISESRSIDRYAFSSSTIKDLILENDQGIGDGAFSFTTIENVTIDKNVTKIPDNIFYYSNLRKIEIPENVIEIGEKGFYRANLPQTFEIPYQIEKIGMYAFCGVELKEFYIISNLELGSLVFYDAKIDKVLVATSVNLSSSGMNFFNDAVIETLEIYNGVTEIPNNRFDGSTINQIIIPETVTSIGEYAFKGVTLPKNFEIPSRITSIGRGAFYSATFPEDYYLEMSSKMTVKEEAFKKSNLKVKEIVIGKDTVLNGYAFDGLTIENIIIEGEGDLVVCPFNGAVINNVEVGESIRLIPNGIFMYSTINSISIPESVLEIDTSAFYSATLPERFIIPSTVKTIDSNAFAYSTLPEGFEIPDTVTTIGSRAFTGSNIVIDELVMTSEKSLDTESFYGLTIKNLVIDGSPKIDYGDEPFSTTVINNLTITGKTSSICGYLFINSNIEYITLSEGVSMIEEYAFSKATISNGIVFPKSLTFIGTGAFKDANIPIGITIPSTVTFISKDAFKSFNMVIDEFIIGNIELCYQSVDVNIRKVVLESEPKSVTGVPFYGIVIDSVEIGPNVSIIPTYLFMTCTINNITIPETVTLIKTKAFANADLPVGFKVPTTTQVEADAFYNVEYIEPQSTTIANYYTNITHPVTEIPATTPSTEPSSEDASAEVVTEESVMDMVETVESTEMSEATSATESQEFATNSQAESEESEQETISATESAETTAAIATSETNEATEVTETAESAEAINVVETTESGEAAETLESTATIVRAGTGRLSFSPVSEEVTETVAETVSEAEIETEIMSASELMSEAGTEAESVSATVAEAEILTESATPVPHTKSYTGLRSNDKYNLYVVRKNNSVLSVADNLSPDNLLYISQFTTDANGNATVTYIPKEEVEGAVELITCLSVYDISGATVEVDQLLYNNEKQEVVVTVTLNGKTLELFTDYDIIGDYKATDIGWYNIIISGVNDYTGEVVVQYAMLPEDGSPIDPPTQAPTETPTESPTEEPTEGPTEEPTEAPTGETGIIKGKDGKYYYVVNGEVDTAMNGLYNWNGTWIYLEGGIWIQDKYDFVDYNGGSFLVANGAVADLSGLVLFDGVWYFLSNGQLHNTYTGLALYDGEWFYVVNGILAEDFNGIKEYDGSKFLVAAGRILYSYSGLYQEADGIWYFIANGQVQTQYTGLALYDEKWFYVKNGVLAVEFTGWVEYDGVAFLVANGMVVG